MQTVAFASNSNNVEKLTTTLVIQRARYFGSVSSRSLNGYGKKNQSAFAVAAANQWFDQSLLKGGTSGQPELEYIYVYILFTSLLLVFVHFFQVQE